MQSMQICHKVNSTAHILVGFSDISRWVVLKNIAAGVLQDIIGVEDYNQPSSWILVQSYKWKND